MKGWPRSLLEGMCLGISLKLDLMRLLIPQVHMSYFWSKDTKAHSCSIWIKITLLGRNFTKVRNIMEKDIKIEMNHVSPSHPFNFLPAKYLPMAIALFISYKMRPIHHSYLLKPWVQYSSWAQYLYLFQIQK